MSSVAAIVMPVGPGKTSTLDTLEGIAHYCTEPHIVVVVDDHTNDGTYEALLEAKRPNWVLLRNKVSKGFYKLPDTLNEAYRYVLEKTPCDLILKIDSDAQVIKHGVLTDAFAYAQKNPGVGCFGVYTHDYNRPRSFDVHRERISREMRWHRRLRGRTPFYASVLRLAERKGYERGDNVFGGAYFLTRTALSGMQAIGALAPMTRWNSELLEDIYFPMAAVAAGFRMGHFAAPEGPLCLEWRGLPHPAQELVQSHYKIVHSVDKGANTGTGENGGFTARQVFQRERERTASRRAS